MRPSVSAPIQLVLYGSCQSRSAGTRAAVPPPRAARAGDWNAGTAVRRRPTLYQRAGPDRAGPGRTGRPADRRARNSKSLSSHDAAAAASSLSRATLSIGLHQRTHETASTSAMFDTRRWRRRAIDRRKPDVARRACVASRPEVVQRGAENGR